MSSSHPAPKTPTQTALTALATTLSINESALKIALTRAFDLLPNANYIPALALHMSFASLGWRIDSQTLYKVISAFRQVFGGALSEEKGGMGFEVPALNKGNRLSRVLGKGREGEGVDTAVLNREGRDVLSAASRYSEPGVSVYSRSIAPSGENRSHVLVDPALEEYRFGRAGS